MYLEHFHLDSRPFEETPDHRFLYLSSQHARALANIEYALSNRDNFVVISGEIGIGKTTLLNRVLDQLPNDVSVARITHTTLTPTELLHHILGEFGVRTYKKNKVYLLDQLREYLTQQKEQGRQVAILVDEAQNLSQKSLEELRLLSCLDLKLAKLVSIVLLGQPDLNDLVDSPEMRQLRQRVRIRQHICPLTRAETKEYIEKRIEVAGGSATDIFSAEAVDRVFDFTTGVPRLINTLCDMALTACWVDEAERVDTDRINAVAQELGWQPAVSPEDEKAIAVPLEDTASREVPKTVHGWLRQAGQDGDEFWVPILQLPFSIGRTNRNRLQLRNPHISRTHAIVEERDGILFLRDENSCNGTFVNARRISRHQLSDGDKLSFGDIEMTFHMRVQAPALSTT